MHVHFLKPFFWEPDRSGMEPNPASGGRGEDDSEVAGYPLQDCCVIS